MSKMLVVKSTDDIRFILNNPTKLGGYESTIYSDEYDNLFKIFDLTKVEYEKLFKKQQVVVALHFANILGVIPEIYELVYTPRGEFIGYSMEYIPGIRLNEFCKSASFGDLLFIFKSLEYKIKIINGLKFCVGDFNPQNILVYANKDQRIVDSDGFYFMGDSAQDIFCDYRYVCPYRKYIDEKYNLYQFYSLFIDMLFNMNKVDNKRKEIIQEIECHSMLPDEIKQKLIYFVNIRNKKGLEKLEYIF